MGRNEQSLRSEVEGFVERTWWDVEAFLAETGIGASVLGRDVAKDPNLIRHIRQGKRKLTLNMAMRLARFVADRKADTDEPVPA